MGNNYGYAVDNEKVELRPGLAPLPSIGVLTNKYLSAKHLQRMRQLLLAPINAIPVDPDTYVSVQTKGDGYMFQDNGSKILAVAHLDTVQGTKHFYCVRLGNRPVVLNAQLDDRLGLWILADLLPAMGLCDPETGRPLYDVLLTTGEEHGQSSAKEFIPPDRDYNWIFSFDRMGGDVVMYGYDNTEMRRLLKSYGFTPGNGSYSDIASLEWLGAKGFNFGCGYEDNHAITSRAFLDTTLTMAAKFVRFWHGHSEIALPHHYVRSNVRVNYYHGGNWGAVDDDVSDWTCDECRKPIQVRRGLNGQWLCSTCYNAKVNMKQVAKQEVVTSSPQKVDQLVLPATGQDEHGTTWPCEVCGKPYTPRTMYYNDKQDKVQCPDCALTAGLLTLTPDGRLIHTPTDETSQFEDNA